MNNTLKIKGWLRTTRIGASLAAVLRIRPLTGRAATAALSLTAALLAFAALSSCSKESPVTPGPTAVDRNNVTITVNIPGIVTPSTRGMDGVPENAVNNVAVLVFSVNDANPANVIETYKGYVTGKDITNNVVGSTYTATFKATLQSATSSRIVLITNYDTALLATITGTPIGTPKQTMLESLKVSDQTEWQTKSAQGIPMYGETAKVNIVAGEAISNIINLVRMLARVDVINTAAGFSMTNVAMSYFNTNGYVAPLWRALDGQILPAPVYTAHVPSPRQTYPYYATTGGTPTQESKGVLYLFESDAADDAVETSRATATSLIVQGVYNSQTYYYRVDFTFEGTNGGAKGTYMPLLRNNKYVVSITSVDGPGYPTYQEAQASYTVPSNMHVKILNYDEGLINDMTFNGQYMLGAEQPKIISSDAQDFDLNIFTDYPGFTYGDGTYSWKAQIVDPSGVGSWLCVNPTLTSTTGAATDKLLHLRALQNSTGVTRAAQILLTAGRLSKTVTITQTTTSMYYLRVIDAYGNDVTQLDFYSVPGVKSDKQTYLVIWSPATASCTENGGGFPNFIDPASYSTVLRTGGTMPVTIWTNTSVSGNLSGCSVTYSVVTPSGTLSKTIPITLTDLSTIDEAAQTGYMPTFAGAFWKNDQTGERLIDVPYYAGYTNGGWQARVAVGVDWINLDTQPSTDPNVKKSGFTPDDMNLNDAAHQVNSNAKFVKGVATSAKPVAFRIGLSSRNEPVLTAAPRYGLVIMTLGIGTSTPTMYRIFIRQGEQPDYLFRTNNETAPGSTMVSRPYAVKWSPYNLMDPAKNTVGLFDQVPSLSVNGGVFVDYPSQGGYLFEYNDSRKAVSFVNTTSGTGSMGNSGLMFWDPTMETCPSGYHRPNDGLNPASTAGGKVLGSEIRQSLMINPVDGSGISGAFKGVEGFYADGFFDRRYRQNGWHEQTPIGQTYYVNKFSIYMAYQGCLIYNLGNNASLFFPASGYALGDGDRSKPGYSGDYWTSSRSDTGVSVLMVSSVTDNPLLSTGGRKALYSIRCVKN